MMIIQLEVVAALEFILLPPQLLIILGTIPSLSPNHDQSHPLSQDQPMEVVLPHHLNYFEPAMPTHQNSPPSQQLMLWQLIIYPIFISSSFLLLIVLSSFMSLLFFIIS